MVDRSARPGRDRLLRRFRAAFATEQAKLRRALRGAPPAAAATIMHRLLALCFLQADRTELRARIRSAGLSALFAGQVRGFTWLKDLLQASPGYLRIGSAALDRLFDFFLAEEWRLGQRDGVDPAMLAAIFEAHINQKEHGAYYTRDDITAYIVERTILPWLLDQLHQPADELITANADMRGHTLSVIRNGSPALRQQARQALTRITIIDPTCGAGAFLFAAWNLLDEMWQALDQSPARVTRNLFGIDLMPEAVELCRLLMRIKGGPAEAATIAVGNVLEPLPWPGQRFDVVIGNPPYLPASKVDPPPAGFATAGCPDVYAWVLERAAQLVKDDGRCGMIVPLSLGFSARFAACRQVLLRRYQTSWFSSFGRIPDALFNFDVRIRNTIHLGRAGQGGRCFSTPLQRWFEAERPTLFQRLQYAPCTPELWQGRIPKPGSVRLTAALEDRLHGQPIRLGNALATKPTRHALHFKKTAYNWLTFCRRLPPCSNDQGQAIPHTQFDTWHFPTAQQRDLAFLFLNGKWAFAWWCIVGDDFHVAQWMLESFPIDLAGMPADTVHRLLPLVPKLEQALRRAIAVKRNAGKRVGTYNLARCRQVTDRSDRIIGEYLGLDGMWDDVEQLCRQVIKTEFRSVAL